MIMPLVKRCCMCGRIADHPHSAIPYKNGVVCDECYVKQIIPARQRKRDYYANKEKID